MVQSGAQLRHLAMFVLLPIVALVAVLVAAPSGPQATRAQVALVDFDVPVRTDSGQNLALGHDISARLTSSTRGTI